MSKSINKISIPGTDHARQQNRATTSATSKTTRKTTRKTTSKAGTDRKLDTAAASRLKRAAAEYDKIMQDRNGAKYDLSIPEIMAIMNTGKELSVNDLYNVAVSAYKYGFTRGKTYQSKAAER